MRAYTACDFELRAQNLKPGVHTSQERRIAPLFPPLFSGHLKRSVASPLPHGPRLNVGRARRAVAAPQDTPPPTPPRRPTPHGKYTPVVVVRRVAPHALENGEAAALSPGHRRRQGGAAGFGAGAAGGAAGGFGGADTRVLASAASIALNSASA